MGDSVLYRVCHSNKTVIKNNNHYKIRDQKSKIGSQVIGTRSFLCYVQTWGYINAKQNRKNCQGFKSLRKESLDHPTNERAAMMLQIWFRKLLLCHNQQGKEIKKQHLGWLSSET